MHRIRIRKSWELPERDVTPEALHRERRKFLRQISTVSMGAALFLLAPSVPGIGRLWGQESTGDSQYLSPESIVTRYNNFYEFGTVKDAIWKQAQALQTGEWKIEIAGLVKKPRVIDAQSLIRSMELEERIYRLRCVEAWALVIPWTGFPLRRWIEKLQPLSSARYVKFTTFLNPNIAAGQKRRFWEPWPYTEGLRLDEAMHPLSFIATGIYGHALPPQNGAPLRLVVPWKHGFKSIKSIARIEFTREEPDTFWQSVSPLEYDFLANVRPEVPYARWEQAYERMPGRGEELIPTQPFNGYAAEVAHLYP